MQEVTDYILVTRGYSSLMSEEVMLWVKRGYTPIGGVEVSPQQGFYQAMVKYSAKETV